MKIENVAVCGMGALGMMYASHMREHLAEFGGSVRFVMDRERLEKYKSRRFYVNGREASFRMTCGECEAPADLVIVAVKSTGLDGAMREIGRCVGEDTVIMSVLNGISSEDIIAGAFGADHMIYTVAQGTDALRDGCSLTYSHIGELRIGAVTHAQDANVRAVAEFLGRAGIPYVVEDDIIRRMWCKFMFNVGLNQTAMVYETDYGGVSDPDGEPYRVMIAAMREVIAVAGREGVNIGEDDLSEYVRMIGTLTPSSMLSMRQDGLARCPSEVEIFSGEVRRLAKKHGILTPTNDYLYKRVREIESGYRYPHRPDLQGNKK